MRLVSVCQSSDLSVVKCQCHRQAHAFGTDTSDILTTLTAALKKAIRRLLSKPCMRDQKTLVLSTSAAARTGLTR